MATGSPQTPRRRVPAAERRDALIEAAVHEFAHGGLHGTPVERIAKRVGVAQPYVFSLFATKRELFLAAVERGFELVTETFTAAAERAGGVDVLATMGAAYIDLLSAERDFLLLQHHAYAACDDEVIREAVRRAYARLVAHVAELSGAPSEALDDFFRHGMWLNVAAAMGVEDLSAGCAWMRAELAGEQERQPRSSPLARA
ncbi:MAG TPA: TetR/AcrR family transcriptional regulator [Solirubrobacteraceae bacterium]|jgi:AcrR family transcriptional regulator